MTEEEFLDKLNDTLEMCEAGITINDLTDAYDLIEIFIEQIEDYSDRQVKMYNVMKELYEEAHKNDN